MTCDVFCMTYDLCPNLAPITLSLRDIKGGNVFIAPNGIVKIGDLGASVSLTKVDASIPGDAPLQGSPFWMAPEVVLQVECKSTSDEHLARHVTFVALIL